MKLTIDFETRSAVNLKDCGAWVYSEDRTTDILCLAVKMDDDEPCIWINPKLREKIDTFDFQLLSLQDLAWAVEKADIIEAHSAEFETAMWQNCFAPKHGAPALPLDKLRCSLAKASYHSLPRSLDGLCKALGLPIQKDSEGHKVMLKMCRPKRLVRAEWTAYEDMYGIPWKNLKEMQVNLYETIGLGWSHAENWAYRNVIDPDVLLHWHEDPQEIVAMCRYCLTDVEAEHAASSALADLPERELRAWQLDQTINARGLGTDPALIENAVAMVEDYTARLLDELATITNGEVQTPKQTAKYLDRVNALLPEDKRLANMQAATVKAALGDDSITGEARRLLEIRKALALSSTAKYEAMKARASKDGRIRGSLLYHGASTGRWSGRGIQPQNLPRGKVKDTKPAIELLRGGQIDTVEAFWPDPMAVASSCIRGVFVPGPGRGFTCADYSNIEGRVVAWLAGEEWKVESFRAYDEGRGPDNYKLAYSRAFGISVEAVTSDNRQIGKVMELACGYQGGVGAFQSMAKNYGVIVEDEKAKELVSLWRQAHPMVCALWHGLDEASILAVSHPEKAFGYRDIAYKMSRCGRFLLCKLPSGRLLHYPFPKLEPAEMPWGETKTVVTYLGTDSTTGKWVKNKLYGGLATENVTQAVARDIMLDGMFEVERAGYETVLTVHDELLAEHAEGFGDLDEFCALISKNPPWAAGLPIAAAGWRGDRYRKG
jgi:DNA polymerase